MLRSAPEDEIPKFALIDSPSNLAYREERDQRYEQDCPNAQNAFQSSAADLGKLSAAVLPPRIPTSIFSRMSNKMNTIAKTQALYRIG